MKLKVKLVKESVEDLQRKLRRKENGPTKRH